MSNRKKIVINAISARQGGGQTYLINLVRHMPNYEQKVFLIVSEENKNYFSALSSNRVELVVIKAAVNRVATRILWEVFSLPNLLRTLGADIYYAPGGVMITPLPEGVRGVTALRNMLPLDDRERRRYPFFSYSRIKLKILKSVFRYSLMHASRIILISQYSAEMASKMVPNLLEKGRVIPHGLNEEFRTRQDKHFELPTNIRKNEFYLYVSILDVYKAQKQVVEAWDELGKRGFAYPIVFVGPKYKSYGDSVIRKIRSMNPSMAYYLGEIPYEFLPSIYRAARGLVFASSCECCPNILLEKLSAGKPVLCSNMAPMPEFAGKAAIYFNPYDPSELSAKVSWLEADESRLELYGKLASQRADRFSWVDTAKRTFEFLLEEDEIT